MKIRDIMETNLIYLDKNSRLKDAAKKFIENDVDALIYKSNSNELSIITKKRLLQTLLEGYSIESSIFEHLEDTNKILYDDMVAAEQHTSNSINLVLDRNSNKLVGTVNDIIIDYMKDLDRYYFELESIIESSYDGIYITDGKANTIKVNKAYERITGLYRDELIGKNMKKIVGDKELSESVTLLVLERRKVTTIQQQFKSGKKALVTGTPIFNTNDEIIMVVTNVRDITELSNLRDQLNENRELILKYYSTIEELKIQLSKDDNIIAEDEKIIKILELAKRVARVDTTVLILAQTASGKEEIAKLIHRNSLRKDKSFVKINCGAIPNNLIESELFGYEKGAFTGANKEGKMGLFEVAEGGTLLLDEVGELPMDVQVKLLRVLQEQEIKRVGGTETIQVDIRILAATNKNLEKMVSSGKYREDLYYRLNVVPIIIPPLRDRKKDIMPLAYKFIESFNQRYNMEKNLSFSVNACLLNYDWPGNIRELKNIIERIVVTSKENEIKFDDLPEKVKFKGKNVTSVLENDIVPLKEALEKIEKQLLEKSYDKFGNVRGAAKALDIHPSTFVRKRKKYTKD